MTPEEVREVAFRKPPIGKRGYDEDQVDALLDHIEDELRGPAAARCNADTFRRAAFRKPSFPRRGYSTDEVDAFLERVVTEWPA